MDDVVSYEVIDRVAHVTIERPEVKNAMNPAVFAQLPRRAAEAGADPEVGAVVVAGRDGTFSSGLDLTVFTTGLGDLVEDADSDGPGSDDADSRSPAGSGPLGLTVEVIGRLQHAFTAFEDLDKPVIAAIEGACFGGGIQLALACHLRAVAPSAQLSVMESRWGLIPDLGGSWRLPRLVGLGRATEMTLTARRVTAEEALRIGLAELSLDSEDPQGQAHDLAVRLAAGPGAVRRAPRLLRDNLGAPRADALRREAETQLQCLAGPDVLEAISAAFEGREPVFVGA